MSASKLNDAVASVELESGRSSSKHRWFESFQLSRIPRLLTIGYASNESQRRHEMKNDWTRLYTVLMFKVENISIVSGLLLASSCNLLIVGDLRRMTHASVSASMFGSILSIIFGILCRINVTPKRIQFLLTRPRLFYYLFGSPSLFGGAAALAFFVAICSWLWIEDSTAHFGWEARTAGVVLSGALIGNAGACFVLGACVTAMAEQSGQDLVDDHHQGADGCSKELPNSAERTLRSDDGLFGLEDWSANLRSLYDSELTLSASDISPLARRGPPSKSFTIDTPAELSIPSRSHVRIPMRRQTAW